MIASRLPHIRSRLILIGTLALAAASVAFAQGSLTPPPGPPAPTMKTLDQLEPRIDLQHAPAAAVDTADENFHYIINQPGSYYLTGNIAVTKPSAIRINAPGVTLDLNGFEIGRAVDTGGIGIEVLSTCHKSSVFNGTIKGFGRGISFVFANSTYASGCLIRSLGISDCTEYGAYVGTASVVESCRFVNNSGSAALFTAPGCTLRDCVAARNSSADGLHLNLGSTAINCTAYLNTSQYAIRANSGCTLTGCSAYQNNSSAAASAGIKADTGCTITHCSSYDNANNGPGSSPRQGEGFDIGPGCIVKDCTANSNEGNGFYVFSETIVQNNNASDNGLIGNGGSGIYVFQNRNRIEDNHVVGNRFGIKVDLAGNLITKNTASFNNVNYEFIFGNIYGAIVAPAAGAAVSGSSAASTLGTTDPFANFTY